MNGKQLKNSILQWAIQGRLVPQDPSDEPAAALLDRIRAEKARLVKEGKLKKSALSDSVIFRAGDNKYYERSGKTVTCIDEDIPFEIPETWMWVRLGNIGETFGGYAFKSTEYTNSGIRVVRISDFDDRGLLYKEFKYFPLSPNLNNYRILSGSILMCMTGGTVGKACLLEQISEEMYLNQRVAMIRSRHVDLRYLYSTLISPYIREIIGSQKTSTNDNISMDTINHLLLPLPPLAEQRRIVAKVEEVMSVVERYEKAQDELDALCSSLNGRLRKSILQEAIQGRLVPQDPADEPAAVLLDRIRAEKARLVKDGKLKKSALSDSVIFRDGDNKYYERSGKTVTCIDDQIPFEIPEMWEWVRLGSVVSTSIGKTPERGHQAYWSNGIYNWVAIADMIDGGVIKSTKEKVSQIAADKCFGDITPAESLIMSFKLTIGRTSILGCDAYHNEAIVTIKPYIDSNSAFRNYLLHIMPKIANSGDAKEAIKGKTLNSKSIFNLLLPLPPLAEQHRIVAKVEELFAVLDRIAGK